MWLVLMHIIFWLSQTWQVTLRIQEYVFSGSIKPPDSKETKTGSSNQETSPSASKNTRVVLVPSHAWKCPYSYFWWCEYLQGPWVSFFLTDEFLVRVTKIASKIGLMNSHLSVSGLFLTHKIALLSKDTNFKSHNSLKLSFINIWGICSDFVECESFLEPDSPDILVLCDTNLDDSNNSD